MYSLNYAMPLHFPVKFILPFDITLVIKRNILRFNIILIHEKESIHRNIASYITENFIWSKPAYNKLFIFCKKLVYFARKCCLVNKFHMPRGIEKAAWLDGNWDAGATYPLDCRQCS